MQRAWPLQLSAALAMLLLLWLGRGAAHGQEAGPSAEPASPTVADVLLRAPRPGQSPDLADLDRLIDELSRHAVPEAEEALSRAREAVNAARGLSKAGDGEGAERAKQLAWSALSLADRHVAMAATRERLARARVRAEAAAAGARAAAKALSRARARLAEVEAGGGE